MQGQCELVYTALVSAPSWQRIMAEWHMFGSNETAQVNPSIIAAVCARYSLLSALNQIGHKHNRYCLGALIGDIGDVRDMPPSLTTPPD